MEGVNTRNDELSFLFLNFDITGRRSSTTGKFAYVWQRERVAGVGIIKMKFRITRSHFLRYPFHCWGEGGGGGSVHRLLSGPDMRIRFNSKNIHWEIPVSPSRESIGTKILKEFYKKCALAAVNTSSGYTHIINIRRTSLFPKLREKEIKMF